MNKFSQPTEHPSQPNRARLDFVSSARFSRMRKPAIPSACSHLVKEAMLNKILQRCGAYYHSADLFYHELWKQRLINIGFRVMLVEKFPYHHVWRIRVCGSLTAQSYLLLIKPVPPKHASADDLLERQLRSEVMAMAKEMGPAIKSDCLHVGRTGKYFLISFIWPVGKPGLLLKKEKKPSAFSFLLMSWLRRNRN